MRFRPVMLLVLVAALSGGAAEPPAARAGGYRGLWYGAGQRSEAGGKYSGGLATFSAHHTPAAVHVPAVDRTYFVYGGAAEGATHLQCMIGCYDHRTGRVARPVVVCDKRPVDDPHDNASLSVDGDGHLWVFVSGRSRLRPGFVYRSSRPYDLAQFERVAEKAMSYPQPWHVPGRGFLHLFTGFGHGRELGWETSPDGRQWSGPGRLAAFGGHDQTSGARGATIATFFNWHPRGDADRRTNLYFMQTTDVGATWTAADGTLLALPLTDRKNAALVADYAAEGWLCHPCDLSFDPAGNPILLHVLSRDARPGTGTADREWRVAHWTGDRWRLSIVAKSDHNYDMGSVLVTSTEWTVIGPTGAGPHPGATGGEIVLWVSRDEGRTWDRRDVTHQSARNHSFVRRPRDARDPFMAFWADGDPKVRSESRLYFCDSSGTRVWRLPADFPEDAAWARPEPLPVRWR